MRQSYIVIWIADRCEVGNIENNRADLRKFVAIGDDLR